MQLLHNNTHTHKNAPQTPEKPTKYDSQTLLSRFKHAAKLPAATISRLDHLGIRRNQRQLPPPRHYYARPTQNNHYQHQNHTTRSLIALSAYIKLFLLAYRHADRDAPSVHISRKSPKPQPMVNNALHPASPPIMTVSNRARKLPSILLANARSLVKKTDSLSGLLTDTKASITCVAETWLNSDNVQVIKNKFNKGYHFLTSNRTDKAAGGVAMLIDKDYATKVSPLRIAPPTLPSWFAASKKADEKPLAIDMKIAKLKVNQLPRGFSSVVAVCVYLAEFGRDASRQRAAVWRIINAVDEATKCTSIGNKTLLFIAGDFNGADLAPLCKALKVHKVNNEPTHIGGGTLDIIMTNAPRCYSAETLDPLISYEGVKSDHRAVYAYTGQADYNATKPPIVRKLVRSGRVANTVNVLRNNNWLPIIEKAKNQPQAATDNFYEVLLGAQDLCQSLKLLKLRDDQPWMTLDIKELIAERQELFKAKQHAEYSKVAVKVSREINKRKRLYYRRKFSAKNPSWWSFVNDVRSNCNTTDADKELANELNCGFHGVWDGNAQPDLSAYTNIDCERPPENIFKVHEVKSFISSMNSSAPGPDGVPVNLLKAGREELCLVLTALFNIFIVIGFVPDQWRSAHITPISKVDHPVCWSDYRPISLTSNICKTFEHVIASYIVSTTWRIWTNNKQHGFLPGRCTQDAIIQVLFDIGRAVDQRESVLAIFFDFAKAFDLVPHDRLMAKLTPLLPPWLVRWIAHYLQGRRQRVKINKITTDWKEVEGGVIQGSVPGPILFILYIADINDYLPKGVSIEKYADDIICYILGRATSTQLPQEVVNAVQRWCHENLMRLNADKCKILHFPAKRDEAPPSIILNNTSLGIVHVYKYLGIDITDTLDSNVYWDRISSKIRQNTFLLKQLKSSGLEEKILVGVFKSLVLSHFRYGSVVLDSCTEHAKSDMQVIQNRMLRIIGVNRDKVSKKYSIPPIAEFIEAASAEQVNKVLNSKTHALPNSLLTTRRSNTKFPYDIPLAKTSKFLNSPVMKALRELREKFSRRATATTAPVLPAALTASASRLMQQCPWCQQ